MATFTPLVFQQPFLNDHGVGTGDLGLWQAPVRGAGIVAALLAYQFVARMGQRGAFFALPVMLIVANLALAGIDYGWARGVPRHGRGRGLHTADHRDVREQSHPERAARDDPLGAERRRQRHSWRSASRSAASSPTSSGCGRCS